MNYLLVRSLRTFHAYYGDEFKVECPTGSGRFATLAEVADTIAARLVRLFALDARGRRPCLGAHPRFADGAFRDRLLFHEYFHGDTGRGIGASHQTGWTGLVASLLVERSGRGSP